MKKLTFIITVLVAGFFISPDLKSQNSNLAKIDEFIDEQMGVFHVPGLSAVIVKDDSIVWNNNYGYMNREEEIPVDDETLFGVVSIGKSVTAAVVMHLWDNGMVGLEQDINGFLPFQVDNPYTDKDSISPRMLMSHSSSIRDYNIYDYVTTGDSPMGLDYFMENYLSVGGLFYHNFNFYPEVPGSYYHYSTIGASLNGYIVEPLTGESFNDYARDSMLIPLEMNNSSWFLEDIDTTHLARGYEYIGGGEFQPDPFYGHPAYPGITLRCSARELSNFVIMLLNNGKYNGTEILSRAAVDSMTTIQNPAWGGGTGGTPGLGLKYKEYYGNRSVWGHDGGSISGYAAHFFFCKEENTGVVVMTNSNQYVDPVVQQLFEYAGLMVTEPAVAELTSTGFVANWETAPTALGYFIDVALDEEFNTFLNGYENLDIGLDTTCTVSGLSNNTEYYFRLRAYNLSDTGAYSNTVNLTTMIVGMDQPTGREVKIWPSGKTLNINISQNMPEDAVASVYTISGQHLGNFSLTDGLNAITLDVRSQPVVVKVHGKNMSFSKKVMIW